MLCIQQLLHFCVTLKRRSPQTKMIFIRFQSWKRKKITFKHSIFIVHIQLSQLLQPFWLMVFRSRIFFLCCVLYEENAILNCMIVKPQSEVQVICSHILFDISTNRTLFLFNHPTYQSGTVSIGCHNTTEWIIKIPVQYMTSI